MLVVWTSLSFTDYQNNNVSMCRCISTLHHFCMWFSIGNKFISSCEILRFHKRHFKAFSLLLFGSGFYMYNHWTRSLNLYEFSFTSITTLMMVTGLLGVFVAQFGSYGAVSKSMAFMVLVRC